jgi:hypothetical protein
MKKACSEWAGRYAAGARKPGTAAYEGGIGGVFHGRAGRLISWWTSRWVESISLLDTYQAFDNLRHREWVVDYFKHH